MKLSKIIALIVVAIAFYWLWTLPIQTRGDLTAQLESLPEYDLRGMAEKFWREGQEDSALIVLDYIIDHEMPDKPGALQLRAQYLQQLKDASSPLGRAKAAGWGFATGEVTSWDSLAGSTVGDLVVYGDLRDLFRETVLEDDADEFVVALSGVGILTTLFPPVDPAPSIIKGLKSSGNLSQPLLRQLMKILRLTNQARDNVSRVQHMKDGLLPFIDLSKHTKTWSDYSTLLKHAESLDQVKTLAKIAADKPDNARKLSQILIVAGKNGAEGAKRAMEVVMNQGRNGMDRLYDALRKGPSGMKFVAEHPTLVSRGMKNAGKTFIWGQREAVDLLRQLGWMAAFIKPVGLGLLAIIFFYLIIPERLLSGSTKRRKSSTKPALGWRPAENLLGSPVALASLLGAAVALVSLLVVLPGLSPGTSAQLASMAVVDGSPAAAHDSAANPALSGLTVVVALAVQMMILLVVRDKISAIENSSDSPSMQTKRLENLDIYFDLPLYAGLALTIFSFVLITYDVGISRVLAYTSTIFGILVAVFIRARMVHPLKERLLMQSSTLEA